MSLIKHYQILEDELKSKPFEEGALYVTTDTNRIFADLAGGGSHTLISASPIILSTETERENLLAPINDKLYFILQSSKMYLYNTGNWYTLTYTHSSYTPHQSGLYRISVDDNGHVNGATAVSKEDITELGIPGQDTTYGVATTSSNGLMTTDMVAKLNGIAIGANKTTIDTAMSTTSTNPVQNKVIKAEIDVLSENIGKMATTEIFKGTLLANNWSASAPFTQTVNIPGLLSTDYPFVDIDLSEVADAQAVIEGWNTVGRVTVNDDNNIIGYCYEEKPTIDIPIVFKVVR